MFVILKDIEKTSGHQCLELWIRVTNLGRYQVMETHSLIFTLFCTLGCFTFIYITIEHYSKYETITDQYYESEIKIKPPLLDICTELDHDSVLERFNENEKQIRKKSNGNKKSTNLSSPVKYQKIIERLTIGDIFKLSENTKSPEPRTKEMKYFIKNCNIRINNTRLIEFHENHDCMKFFSIRKYLIGEWIYFTFDPLPGLASNGSNDRDRIIEFPINNIIPGGSGISYQ